MTKIVLDIKGCEECPFLSVSRVITADSFDSVEKWKCQKKKMKVISGYKEWSDEVPVPEWCPLKVDSIADIK